MKKISSDKLSILLSTVCIIHCFTTPFLVVYLPTTSIINSLHNESIHYIVAFISICISLFSVYKRNKNTRAFKVIILGYSFYVIAVLTSFFTMSHSIKDTLFVFGAFFLVLGHYIIHKECCKRN